MCEINKESAKTDHNFMFFCFFLLGKTEFQSTTKHNKVAILRWVNKHTPVYIHQPFQVRETILMQPQQDYAKKKKTNNLS